MLIKESSTKSVEPSWVSGEADRSVKCPCKVKIRDRKDAHRHFQGIFSLSRWSSEKLGF